MSLHSRHTTVQRQRLVLSTTVLSVLLAATTAFCESWPQFRGPRRDGKSSETGLLKKWPGDGPKLLWSLDVGEGHAGPAVRNGKVYIIDYDRENSADAIRCLSLDDGREIWRYSYPIKVKRNHGMSRTVPAVTDKFVVTIGPKCHVTCLDSQTGEFLWMLNLAGDFGATIPQWYAGQCPLIDDGKAIIAVGARDLLIAVDLATGKIVWRTPNPRGWKMTHSSIVPAQFAGKRMYIYSASGGCSIFIIGYSIGNHQLLVSIACDF